MRTCNVRMYTQWSQAGEALLTFQCQSSPPFPEIKRNCFSVSLAMRFLALRYAVEAVCVSMKMEVLERRLKAVLRRGWLTSADLLGGKSQNTFLAQVLVNIGGWSQRVQWEHRQCASWQGCQPLARRSKLWLWKCQSFSLFAIVSFCKSPFQKKCWKKKYFLSEYFVFFTTLLPISHSTTWTIVLSFSFSWMWGQEKPVLLLSI